MDRIVYSTRTGDAARIGIARVAAAGRITAERVARESRETAERLAREVREAAAVERLVGFISEDVAATGGTTVGTKVIDDYGKFRIPFDVSTPEGVRLAAEYIAGCRSDGGEVEWWVF